MENLNFYKQKKEANIDTETQVLERRNETKEKEEKAKMTIENILESENIHTKIIEGAGYSDYLEALNALDGFTNSNQEKFDLIRYTAESAISILHENSQESEFVTHRFYTDRSSRVLGFLLHKTLSETGMKMNLDNSAINFINPRNILNGEDESKKEKIKSILQEGSEEGKKVINLIVDEFIASGGTTREVEREFSKLIDPEKIESGQIAILEEGFYSGKKESNFFRYVPNTDWEPSWLRNSTISGVEEIIDEYGLEKIVPYKKVDRSYRESLSAGSQYIANIVEKGFKTEKENNCEYMSKSLLNYYDKKIAPNLLSELPIWEPSKEDMKVFENKLIEYEKISNLLQDQKSLDFIERIKLLITNSEEKNDIPTKEDIEKINSIINKIFILRKPEIIS